MTAFIVGATAHGVPAVSSLLVKLAEHWPQPEPAPIVIEAESTGGLLAARHGVDTRPGFGTLSEALRKLESPDLVDHVQQLANGVSCVPISASATAASAQLRSAAAHLGPYLAEAEQLVLLDAGTLVPTSKLMPTVHFADLLVWFVRPVHEELLVLRHRLVECAQPDEVAIVLVGDPVDDVADIGHDLGLDVDYVLPDPAVVSDDEFDAACETWALDLSKRVGAVIEPELVVWLADEEPQALAAEETSLDSGPRDPDLVVWVNDASES